MSSTLTVNSKSYHDDMSRFFCGFASGLVQAGLFNPWDRALYLSVKFERKFLHPLNFVEPWKGVLQTLIQRAISAGFYFPLEDIFRRFVDCQSARSSYSAIENIIYTPFLIVSAFNISCTG